jgi:DNA-binding LacI/PurR family transcriptional regulator
MKTKMGRSCRKLFLSKIGINGMGSNESLPPPISTVAVPILVLHRKAHEGFIESMKKRENSRTGSIPKAGLKRFGIGVKQK